MKIFNSSCFCFSLETGGYIIGWLNILVSFLASVFCTSVLSILSVSIESNHNSEVVRKITLESMNFFWINEKFVKRIEAKTFCVGKIKFLNFMQKKNNIQLFKKLRFDDIFFGASYVLYLLSLFFCNFYLESSKGKIYFFLN
jgi:hypothetical protein